MKFSIIVPIYNVEIYLRKCLDSIKDQSFSDFECILVDDGSPNNSGIICNEYVSIDRRFKVIHKTNGGLSHASNIGVENATGEYVYFLYSNDFLDRNAFSILVNRMQNYNLQLLKFSSYSFNDEIKDESTWGRKI